MPLESRPATRWAARCNGSATGPQAPTESGSAVWVAVEGAGLRALKGPEQPRWAEPEYSPPMVHRPLKATAPEENWSSAAHRPEGA